MLFTQVRKNVNFNLNKNGGGGDLQFFKNILLLSTIIDYLILQHRKRRVIPECLRFLG